MSDNDTPITDPGLVAAAVVEAMRKLLPVDVTGALARTPWDLTGVEAIHLRCLKAAVPLWRLAREMRATARDRAAEVME